MNRGCLLVTTTIVMACGGSRVAVAPQPVTAVAAVDSSRRGPAARPIADTTARHARTLAVDSVADAQALDSLAESKLSANLPDVSIDHATWDLNVASFSDQPRVRYYLDYFSGRAHDRFQVWLQRMGQFEAYAREQFAARKLPGDFVYLALIESGFSPEAVSHSRAVGMWQFMLGTGKVYGLRVDSWIDERRDPIKSTDAAAHHLDDLTHRFGSHYLAAAAYNAGAGRVERGLDHMGATAVEEDSLASGGDSAFFSLADTRLIRDETKNYVPQLIAAAIIAKEPNTYGFDAPSDVTPFSRDSVMVDGSTGLDLIARLADTTLEALHELNPNLLRMVTPPGERYPVRVPAGSVDRILAGYDTLSPDARHAVTAHQVAKGETVASISKHFAVPASLIRSVNRAARGRSLPPGTVLYLPASTTTISAAVLREPDPPRTTRTTTRTVIVRAGESVASVARRAGVSVATLRSQNGLGRASRLRAGQRLTARRTVVVARASRSTGRRVAFAPVRPTTRVRTHVVKRGETVYTIAKNFNVKPALLMAVNGLDKSGTVRAGQTLRIPHG